DYVTTLEDPNADKIVTQLLNGLVSERVYPVGRLDKNSLGVLLLTNDGEFTKILTHPSFSKKKIYHVSLDKALHEEDMEKLATGVELEDGLIFADEISCDQIDKKEVGIEIHSGRNRVVRRMFEHLGYKVRRLDRVYFAGLTKKGLQRGEWRYLTQQEVESIKKEAQAIVPASVINPKPTVIAEPTEKATPIVEAPIVEAPIVETAPISISETESVSAE
ncbi:MAG: pseudouridine synthase, partial [Rikenellaceae bacterium]